MKKEPVSVSTYIKLLLLFAGYFYLLIYSGYRSWLYLADRKEIGDPIKSLTLFVVCIMIAVYVMISKPGKTHPLDKKVGILPIILVILLFFAMVAAVYWYGTR